MQESLSGVSTFSKESGFAGPNIELTFGPMFSGKTSELIKKAEIAKLQYPEYKVLYIMNSLDAQRDILSHSKIFENYKNHIELCHTRDLTDLLCVTQQEECSSCAGLLNEKTFYSCICIDEAQFFKDLYPFIDRLKTRKNIMNIYIGGLDGNCKMEKFQGSQIYDIIPFCDVVEKKHSLCKVCLKNHIKKAAPFTKLREELTLPEGDILIAGDDVFYPVCKNHFYSSLS